MPQETTTLAERYVLEAQIASGGMATVWRARDQVLARTVAVKLLHPHLTQDEAFVERFRREALAAARLTHPNIVAIYDTGSDPAGPQEQHFIVMEYCSGGSLHELLARREVSPSEAAGITGTICDALAYAHSCGIVHRDIKPGNVLLSEHGSLKVTDFGIAKAAFTSGDLTTTGEVIGTVTYISPEQASGEEPDPRSDIYSLGVMLFEMLTGRPPFRADTDVAVALQHVRDEVPSPRSIRAGIPRAMEAVVMKSLAKDPDARYGSAHEMKAALGADAAAPAAEATQTMAVTPPPAARAPAPPAAGRERSFLSTEARRIAPIIALVVGAIAVAALIAALASSPEDTSGGGGSPQAGAGATSPLQIRVVTDFDPYGGDGEHPEDAHLAADGDTSTAWNTSDYRDPLKLIGKPGVGLVFDLGSSKEVTAATIDFGSSGYAFELLAGDSVGEDETSFTKVVTRSSSAQREELEFDATEARYWCVWFTGFPGGGGGRGTIAEVQLLGP